MVYIIFKQTRMGRIKFTTDEIDDAVSMKLQKFRFFLKDYPIMHRHEFENAMDSFQTVYLDVMSGKWDIIKPDIGRDRASFDVLYNLNDQEKKKEQEKLEQEGAIIGPFKAYSDKVWKDRRDNFVKKNGLAIKKVLS